MSRVTKLLTTNTKGHDLATELSGRDLFTGPNGSGKSAHLESFMIGVMGKIPGRSNTLDDVFKLCSDDSMSITLEHESGFRCTRDIIEKRTRHKDGTKSFSHTMKLSVHPPKGEENDKEKKARIVDEFGDFAMMFNLEAFFELSDNERRKFVFSLSDPSQFGWDRERFTDELKLIVPKSPHIDVLGEMWDEDVSVQENIARYAQYIKDAISTTRAAHKKAAAAKEQLLKQKREIGSNPGSPAELMDELEAARGQDKKLTADLAAAKERTTHINGLRQRERALKAEVSAERHGPSADELQAQKRVVDSISTDIAEKEMEQNQLQAQMNEAMEKYRVAIQNLGSNRVEPLRRQIELVSTDEPKCPITLEPCTVDFTDYIKRQKALLAEAERREKKRSEEEGQAHTTYEECENKIKGIDISLVTLRNNARAETRKLSEMDKEYAVELERVKQREKYQKELEDVEKQLRELPPVDTSPLEASLSGLKERISTLETELAKRNEIQNLMKSFDTANIRAEELDQELEALMDLEVALGPQNIQGKVVRDTIGPLIKKINELLSETGRGYNLHPLLEDKNGKEIFDFAWRKGSIEIPFHTLSGGEKIVFGAALACALVLQKNPKLKALAIEASETDRSNLTTLMEAISEFGKDLDNVLIATHVVAGDDTFTAPADWTMHDLGVQVAASA